MASKATITIPLDDGALGIVRNLARMARSEVPGLSEDQFIEVYLAPALLTGVVLNIRAMEGRPPVAGVAQGGANQTLKVDWP